MRNPCCPYTFFKSIFSSSLKNKNFILDENKEAKHLRVLVEKNNKATVDVSLPAVSSNWLIDLIPENVLIKIKNENIPIEDIQKKINEMNQLNQMMIFSVNEENKSVTVWLE